MNLKTKYKFIAIEGNIGVGKTTLSQTLAEKFELNILLESFKNNPYLVDFYLENKAYNLHTELFFLVERFEQVRYFQISESVPVVSDYIFDKSRLFAQNNLSSNDLELFERIYSSLYLQIRKPDIIVYLSKSVEVLQRNIQKRGRTYELNIESKYLQNVEHQYQNYFNSIDYCPVLQFNLNDDQELETLVIAIKNVLEKDWQNGIHLIPSYKY